MDNIIFEKAVKLLKESSTLALSVIDEEGYPKVYAMEKVYTENLKRVVFITKKHSNKVELLNKNNKCCVEIHTEDDSICLQGTVEIMKSEKDKTDILPEAYIKRLIHSGSEKYCVLIFNTSKSYLYINEESIVLYF